MKHDNDDDVGLNVLGCRKKRAKHEANFDSLYVPDFSEIAAMFVTWLLGSASEPPNTTRLRHLFLWVAKLWMLQMWVWPRLYISDYESQEKTTHVFDCRGQVFWCWQRQFLFVCHSMVSFADLRLRKVWPQGWGALTPCCAKLCDIEEVQEKPRRLIQTAKRFVLQALACLNRATQERTTC